MEFTWGQVKQIVDFVRPTFTEIRAKYKELQPYMVFSSPLGQIGIEAGAKEIQELFLAMIATSHAGDKAPLFRGDVNIELRFGQLKYELVRQLQQDPLIDAELTPQTGASIRIVITNLDRAWARISSSLGQ